MDLQACVQDALEALPETPKAIAEVLIAGGHKAIRGNWTRGGGTFDHVVSEEHDVLIENGMISPNCPISRYVRAHCQVPEDQEVISGPYSVTVWGNNTKRALVHGGDIPEKVTRFMRDYDGGAFPELRPS